MSDAHRALLGLARATVAGRADAALGPLLAGADPLLLAEIAQFHRIHTCLGHTLSRDEALLGALPLDLRTFFLEIGAANVRRNAAIREQALEIGRAASASGIRLVALKGAAFLLDPGRRDATHRYLSDIDLLVRAEDMPRARDVLAALGGVRQDGTVPDGHHHDPAVLAADWAVPVELHASLGDARVDDILPASEVLRAATPSGHPGLAVPAPHHRLAHVVAHGQLSGHGHAACAFSLRDCLDFETLRRNGPRDAFDEAGAAFERAGAGQAFASFEALTARVFGRDPARSTGRFAAIWASAAMAVYGRAELRRALDTLAWLHRNSMRPIVRADRRRAIIGMLKTNGSVQRALEERRRHMQGLR